MPRNLFLMRHAKSSWKDDALKDFDRPLAKRGVQDLPVVADWFKAKAIMPGAILASPALRAKSTIEGLCDAWGVSRDRIQFLEKLYLADRSTLVSIIHEHGNAHGSLLIVAHNPGLEHLLNFLVADPIPLTKQGKLMTTANVAHVTVENEWRQLDRGKGKLIEVARPKVLRESKLLKTAP